MHYMDLGIGTQPHSSAAAMTWGLRVLAFSAGSISCGSPSDTVACLHIDFGPWPGVLSFDYHALLLGSTRFSAAQPAFPLGLSRQLALHVQ